ncbi:LacI family DNA-binding transcriptional regulator [Streptomyces hypolithicus]
MTRQAPTLEDVARAAGVSRATVSRVVNGIRNVDPAIREAVREAIGRTGYAPNRAARTLVTRRAETIALVVSGAGDDTGSNDTGSDDAETDTGSADTGTDASTGGDNAFAARVLADPFFGRAVSGVVGFLRPRSVFPVLMFAESEPARQQVLTYLRQGSADGALVFSTHAEDPLPALLAAESVPCVLFARPAMPTAPLTYVDLAHRDGGRLAAEHLLARGCRRVATVAGPLDLPAAQDRLAGFQDTMARRGHPYIPIAEGGFTFDSGAAAMTRLLAEHPEIDGVFAANDLMAQGVCHAVREAGKRVPEDVAVVGFDDSSAAVGCRPPLTTVRQPVEEMAAAMARLLQEQIEGKLTTPTSLIFEPELVLRASA